MIPVFDETGKETRERKKVLVNREEFWDLIAEICTFKPQIPVYHIVSSFKVCLVSAGLRELEQLISIEAAARDYHELPFDGGWLDQSNIIIEAFDIIRSTRNRFELERIEKDK